MKRIQLRAVLMVVAVGIALSVSHMLDLSLGWSILVGLFCGGMSSVVASALEKA